MKNLTCPCCFSEAGECFWRDVGGPENFIDEYTFYCGVCGYIIKKEKNGGTECGIEEVTYCDFCEEVFWNHQAPPKELCFFV